MTPFEELPAVKALRSSEARRTAEGSPPVDGALERREHLAPSELTPCFHSPPSQPGGEAERLVRLCDGLDGAPVALSRAGTIALVADLRALLAQRDALEAEARASASLAARYLAEGLASEQKLAALERITTGGSTPAEVAAVQRRLLDEADSLVIASLEQRLSAALESAAKWERTARAEVDAGDAAVADARSERDTVQALLRRVVEAVEPARKLSAHVTNSELKLFGAQDGEGPLVWITGADIHALATLSSEITALLPSGTGEAEGEGR